MLEEMGRLWVPLARYGILKQAYSEAHVPQKQVAGTGVGDGRLAQRSLSALLPSHRRPPV